MATIHSLIPEHDLKVAMRATSSLTPNPRNSRTHNQRQLRKLRDAIRRFGFVTAILIDEKGMILCGHARWLAAQMLGLQTVPTVTITGMSSAELRAFVIADNRLAELAGYDKKLLAEEFEFLIESGFDVSLTGFDGIEIDAMFAIDHSAAEPEELVELPEPTARAVSRLGDLWLVGQHRILCGDALQAASYDLLLDGEHAQMVFSDPPYNVRIAGHVSGLGAKIHREFAQGSGEMSKAEFTAFLRTSFRRLAASVNDGTILFICMDWRHMSEILDAADGIFELKNLIVWAKTNAGMGTFFRSQHELIFAFKFGTGKNINNFELGQGGRHRSNLWTYTGANTFRRGRQSDLESHPTVKPVKMVADAILDCSHRGGLILDPFGGSGTTALAAHRTGRRSALIELDPLYVDTIIRRLAKETGEIPRLNTGESFEEIARSRGLEGEAR